MDIITIYACPHNCASQIVAKIEVEAKWTVDEQGNLLNEIDSGLTSADYLDMRCGKCHAPAEEIICENAIPIFEKNDPSLSKIGTVYIPVEWDGTGIYWKNSVDAFVQWMPMKTKNNKKYFSAAGKTIYLCDENKFIVEQECCGQISMDGSEVQ